MRRQLEKHQTLREKILETIRNAILTGELKPGARVSEPDLAARFGISRTPIREAFRQLESEGYLTVIPRKGAVVATFSPKDIEEFYEIKSILEGYAARKATPHLTPRDLERLRSINARLGDIAATGDVNLFFKAHNEFHELFIRACGNEKLADMIRGLVGRFKRLRTASLSMPGRMEISVTEHAKIIDAFERRDPNLAETLVRKNAEFGGRVLLDSAGGSDSLSPVEKRIAGQMDL
ncbi:MAG: GntR family transcriptional regulator [Desulfuromonadia bacterium]